MSSFEVYSERYSSVAMRRDKGIIELRLHTDGGPLTLRSTTLRELGGAFADVGGDPENRVVIITGTGDAFLPSADYDELKPEAFATPVALDRVYREAIAVTQNLLAIGVPTIAAVNGPARMRPELPVLCDIVIASETACFRDAGHFNNGVVPGDGSHVVWPLLLGYNRARYFMLTGQELSAQDALGLGVISEIVPRDRLNARAWELAREMAKRTDLTLRYTREVLVGPIRDLMQRYLGPGLALEGLAKIDLKGSRMSRPLKNG